MVQTDACRLLYKEGKYLSWSVLYQIPFSELKNQPSGSVNATPLERVRRASGFVLTAKRLLIHRDVWSPTRILARNGLPGE